MIIELGALGSVVNAMAMIGSVIYLALQVRQANRLARLSVIDSLRDATNHFREVLLCGDNLEVWVKGVNANAELTDTERYRWNELALYLWDSTQATYLRAAQLGERYTVRRIAYSVRYASRGADFLVWWNERRDRFHPAFVTFVDDHLGQSLESLKGAELMLRRPV